MTDFKAIASFFTGAKQEGCEVAASKMFDANAHKIVTMMQHAGDEPEDIKTAVAQQKTEYVANVCKKPGPKP